MMHCEEGVLRGVMMFVNEAGRLSFIGGDFNLISGVGRALNSTWGQSWYVFRDTVQLQHASNSFLIQQKRYNTAMSSILSLL